jgi:hypothetical protein
VDPGYQQKAAGRYSQNDERPEMMISGCRRSGRFSSMGGRWLLRLSHLVKECSQISDDQVKIVFTSPACRPQREVMRCFCARRPSVATTRRNHKQIFPSPIPQDHVRPARTMQVGWHRSPGRRRAAPSEKQNPPVRLASIASFRERI